MTIEKINSRAPLDRSPKKNWVENAGGLPMYIRRIANHLHQEKGKTIGHSIAIAVNAAKKMCGTGDLNFKGKQNVNPKSRAEACAAVAQWERKKAGARVSKGDFGRKWSDEEFIQHLTGETVVMSEIEKLGFKPSQKRGTDGTWVRTNGAGDKNLGDKYHPHGKKKRGSKNTVGSKIEAGSDVKGGKKRDQSFSEVKGAKTGTWQRIVGSGKKGVARDTKVGVFAMENGKTAVFVRRNGKDHKVGEFDSEEEAQKRAATAIKNHMSDETKGKKKSTKKAPSTKSSSSTPSRSSSSAPNVRPSTKKTSAPKKKAPAKKVSSSQKKRASTLRSNGLPVAGMVAKISDSEFEELSKSVDEFFEEGNADSSEFAIAGKIEKKDNEKQLVFGWASIAKLADGTEVVDKQGDVLEDIEAMENVAYDFMLNSRDGGEMHVRKGVSRMVESYVSTPEKNAALGIPDGTLPTGWWVGFKVDDKDVWEKVKKKEYSMFSVHGSGVRTPIIAKDEN